MTKREPPPEYFLDMYGACALAGGCLCLDRKRNEYGGAWVGRVCPRWRPLGATTFAELKQMQHR